MSNVLVCFKLLLNFCAWMIKFNNKKWSVPTSFITTSLVTNLNANITVFRKLHNKALIKLGARELLCMYLKEILVLLYQVCITSSVMVRHFI